MGVRGGAAVGSIYVRMRVVSLSKNMTLCSHVSKSVALHLLPLLSRTLPFTVRHVTSLATGNSVISYLQTGPHYGASVL